MSERDELAALFESIAYSETPEERDDAEAKLRVMLPKKLAAVEEIRDLPALTMVVYDDIANGGPLEAYVVPDDGTVMFKDRYPFHLLCMNGEYVKAEDMPLPLTVVYEAGGAA